MQREEVQKQDGTRVSTHYDDSGKVSREIVARKDGSRQVSRPQFARDGTQRAVETVHYDTRGAAVSRTVEVKQTTVIANRTTIINNTTVIKHYDRCRYGYAYRPVVFVHSPVFISWYDPFWYTPAGIFIVHPFSYSWGWYGAPWYRCHRYYWSTYEVYPGPAYWLTDWMLAGYLADRYAMSVSLEQAQEEARRAREDAERARQVAEQARDAAEIAEARRARDEAEARAAKAEARAARAEAEEAKAKETDVKANPNATPIDAKTKEALKDQIERTIAEKKDAGDGKAIVADLSKALADPKHIYPVSRTIDVTLADNGNRAGNLTEGDLLRLEPGQDLKNANENTLVTMRVMTSKGEDDEVKAGTLISVGLKDLQEFDNEFRAKVDLGMAEADQNKELFKKGAK